MAESYPLLCVDAKGFVWWQHSDGTFSMVRTNQDNSRIPRPIAVWIPSHIEGEDVANLAVEIVATLDEARSVDSPPEGDR